jgi:hypothetical protein
LTASRRRSSTIKGLTNQRNIYLDHAAILRSLDCHVLYTVPIELAFSDAHLRLKAAYGCETLLLPLIPVSQRNGEDCLEGIRALMPNRSPSA